MPVTKDLKVSIPAPNIKLMTVNVQSTAPILYHKWDQKAIQQMEDKQAGKAKSMVRQARNPDQDYFGSFYLNAEGAISIPARNIKQATVGSVRNLTGVTMALVRGALFILGDKDGYIPLLYKGKEIKLSKTVKKFKEGTAPSERVIGFDPKYPANIYMCRDMVTVGMGGTDIRYRGQVNDWELKLLVRYNADVLSAEQVLNLIHHGGFSCGVGEWRPEKNGDFGTYTLLLDEAGTSTK
jgi:hypothetical protein